LGRGRIDSSGPARVNRRQILNLDIQFHGGRVEKWPALVTRHGIGTRVVHNHADGGVHIDHLEILVEDVGRRADAARVALIVPAAGRRAVSLHTVKRTRSQRLSERLSVLT
jgi:hypothetical protein